MTGRQDLQASTTIQGLEAFSEKEILWMVKNHFNEMLEYTGIDAQIVDMKIIGSRAGGKASEKSDLDVLLEYKGKIKEDALFNILNDSSERLFIDKIPVDINPITRGQSGTIAEWMERNREYMNETSHAHVAATPADTIRNAVPNAGDSIEIPRMNIFVPYGAFGTMEFNIERITNADGEIQAGNKDGYVRLNRITQPDIELIAREVEKSSVETKLKDIIGEGSVNFTMRNGKPLCIVNDDFGSDPNYVMHELAYIREVGIRNGKPFVVGDIDRDGIPVRVTSISNLEPQGARNLLEELSAVMEKERKAEMEIPLPMITAAAAQQLPYAPEDAAAIKTAAGDYLQSVVDSYYSNGARNGETSLSFQERQISSREDALRAAFETSYLFLTQAEEREPGILKRYGIDDLQGEARQIATETVAKAEAILENRKAGMDRMLQEGMANLNEAVETLNGLLRKADPEHHLHPHVTGYSLEKHGEDDYALLSLYDEDRKYLTSIISAKEAMTAIDGLTAEISAKKASLPSYNIDADKRTAETIHERSFSIQTQINNPIIKENNEQTVKQQEAVQQRLNAEADKKAASKEFIQVLSLDLDDINLRLSKDPMKNNILESLKYKIFFKDDATSVDDVIKAKRQGVKYEMKIAEDYGWNFKRLDGPLFLISNIKNKPVQTLHISVDGQNISLDRHIQTAIWQKNITQPIASFELKEFNNQNSLDNQKNKQEYVVWLSGNPNTLSGMGDVLNFDKKEDVYKRLMVYDYKTEWSGTKDDIIKDAGKTYFIYEHVSPAEYVKEEISRTIRKSLVDLAKENGVINEEDIKLMNQIASKKEGINNANKPKINPSFNKEDKNMSKEKEKQQSVGEAVNAVQQAEKAMSEKKAAKSDIGKEAKSIIHLDNIAEKVRGKSENPDQSVVIVRSRDVASKVYVYQAFGEDAARLASQSKNVELNTPTINGKQYSVAKFPEESAKAVAKDLAAANVSVNLVNGRGESIPNDKAFSQATSVKEASNANSERIRAEVTKEYEARISAYRQGQAADKGAGMVVLELRQQGKEPFYQTFDKDAAKAAAITDKETKITQQGTAFVSMTGKDFEKVRDFLQKEGKQVSVVEYATDIKERIKEGKTEIRNDSKVEFDISKNLHAKGIYDIKLIVDDNKVAAHHLSKEDRDAFFKKEMTGSSLVQKYFADELKGATPEVTRASVRKEEKADMTTVNGEKVSNARVFTSEKGNNYFVANLEGRQLRPQYIDADTAARFKEGKIPIEEIMAKAYPTKVMPRLTEEQFKAAKISDGRDITFFRIAKEENAEKKDAGKYKLEAVVDGKRYKSAALPVRDINEYFDRVTSKASLVERHFGEALNLKSAYEKYKLPEGAEMGVNANFKVVKDNAQRRYFISGEVNGVSLDRKQLNFHDSSSYWKKSANEEQLGAKYFNKEVKGILNDNPLGQKREREVSIKR